MFKKMIRSLEKICFIAGLIFLLWAIFTKLYAIMVVPYPKELREMNLVKFAEMFSDFKNPYEYSLIYDEQPFPTNMYGFWIPLLVGMLIKIIPGADILQLCEITSLIVEIIGLILIYVTIYKKTQKELLAIWGALLIDVCYWRYAAFGGFFPDVFGVSLQLYLIWLIHNTRGEYRRRGAIFVLIALFYIKQYFVCIGLGVFLYLMIHDSVKSSFKFLFQGIGCGIISIIIVDWLFPLYFSETLPLAQGQATISGYAWSTGQIIGLFREPFGIIGIFAVMMLIYLFILGYKRIKMKKEVEWKTVVSYELLQVVCVFPLVLYISQNVGTYYTYYLQIWCPYVIVYGIFTVDYFIEYLKKKEELPGLNYVICALAVLYAISVYKTRTWIINEPLDDEQMRAWEKAYEILTEKSGQGEIVVSPHLSDFCLENDIYTWDYGQAECTYTEGNYQNWKESVLWKRVFPEAENILKTGLRYNNDIYRNIEEGEYALIAVMEHSNINKFILEMPESKYVLGEQIILMTGKQEWKTNFWMLKE